jgi:hypothetical protein
MPTISSPQIWSSIPVQPIPKPEGSTPQRSSSATSSPWYLKLGWLHGMAQLVRSLCRWAACEAQFVLGTRHWGAFHIQRLCLSFMNLLTTLTWTTLGVLWRSKFTSEDSQINFGLWEAWSALETNLTLKIGMHFLPWKLLTFCWYGHWDFLSSS